MNVPGFNAKASVYNTGNNYHFTWTGGGGTRLQAGPARFTPQLLPLPNGNGGPFCHPIFGQCSIPDPGCPSKFSRFILRADCTSDMVCCTPPCPTICTPCTGGSCGAYPTCGPVAGSGTQTCTDCHGAKTNRSC
jgi:hypothetical protein